MQELLDLDDITLIPSVINNGWRNNNQINYLTRDIISGIPESLPIFTSPMPAVIDEKNWKLWISNKINSVIPRTVNINTRLDLSQYTFSCLSWVQSLPPLQCKLCKVRDVLCVSHFSMTTAHNNSYCTMSIY